MTLTIVDRDTAPKGVLFRRSRAGPELSLLNEFLPSMPLARAPDSKVTVLREPGLESGFPDLVIVVWRSDRTVGWGSARLALVPQDLRLMHYIHARRRVVIQELADQFGRRVAVTGIQRLHAARMVRQDGPAWLPCAFDRLFAATKIIAVEAKIGNWAEALRQARLNTWFASKSYVLVPRATNTHIAQAQQLGIGVLALDSGTIVEWPSKSARLPRSYASWFLNDLAWRASSPLPSG